jgi:hypothetical protein
MQCCEAVKLKAHEPKSQGSGALLPPGYGIRDGAMVGSGIRDKLKQNC